MRCISVSFLALLVVSCIQEDGWKPTAAPLEVTVVGQDLRDEQVQAVIEGAARWEKALGRPVIRLRVASSARARCGQVVLSFASLQGVTNGTTTRLDCRASIQLREGLSPAYMAVVAAHELGHALGLDHDGDERSLMYTSAPYDGGTIPRPDVEYVQSLLETPHDAGF
jgi:hypothetical protein